MRTATEPMSSLSTITQDFRDAFRSMRSSIGLTSIAILSLSLAIGGTVAIFSVMYALILRPLPVLQPERLVQITRSNGAPYHPHAVWKGLQDGDRDGPFSGVLAYYPWDSQFALTTGGQSEQIPGLYVSGNFFEMLGVPAIAGRTLTVADDRPGAMPACMISYTLWQREYRRSRAALGQTIVLNGHAFEIVGVAPQSFFGLEVGKDPQIFAPLEMQRAFHDYGTWNNGNAKPTLDHSNALVIIGRLKLGVSINQADAWLRVAGVEIYKSFSKLWRGTLDAHPMPAGMSRSYVSDIVLMMMVMAGVALFIACANLGNLLLARATRREGEMATRLALGATRWRVVRQLLVESLVLSIAGTAGGLLLSHWGSRALLPVISSGYLTVLDLSWDLKLALFAVGATLVSAILFGLAPAIRASRVPLYSAMQQASATSSGRNRLSNLALIAVQVALSIALFDSAGLLVRTLHALMAKDPGYEANGVLVARVGLKSASNDAHRQALEGSELLNTFRTVPGVISASRTANSSASTPPEIKILQPGGSERQTRAYRFFVSPDFFATRRTAMLAGRDFNEKDGERSIAVAILSEQAASMWFHGTNPIGLTFHENDEGDDGRQYSVKVVGIARSIDFNGPNYGPLPVFYRPASQCSACAPMGRYEVRFAGPLSESAKQLRDAATSLDPNLALELHPLSDETRAMVQQNRSVAWMATAFGIFAALLAMIGVYGVTSYAASQRTREIGIRITLGAQPHNTLRMILGESAIAVAIGIAFGIPAARAGAGMIRKLLWGVAPNDFAVFGLAVALMLVVGFLAAFLPARRATRIDPMICLRYE